MKDNTKNSASQAVTARFDPFYVEGMRQVLERKRARGFSAPTKTDILKEGLEAVFRKYKVNESDIIKALNKTKENKHTKS